MLTYLLGLPGSGKTYYAVDKIWNNFSNDKLASPDKKTTFKNCYTNINEFNFDKIENVYSLDFDKLYMIISRLHKLYKAKKTDKYLVSFLSKVGLKDTLFVIDEAHNYFDKKDLVLVWWLSYHRHLFHEIILITQNLSLIESKYKSFSEFFYVAKPRSLILDRRYFKFNVFCHSRLTLNSKSGSIKIKQNDSVFSLYKSGDSITSSNIILKFIMISVFLMFFLVTAFYLYIGSLQKDSVPISPAPQIKTNTNTFFAPQHVAIDTTDKIIFVLSCSFSSCNNEDFSLPPQLITQFIESKNIKNLYTQKVNKYNSIFYLEATKDFYNYLIPYRSQKNENNNVLATDSFPSLSLDGK